jgi:hypothetical protein
MPRCWSGENASDTPHTKRENPREGEAEEFLLFRSIDSYTLPWEARKAAATASFEPFFSNLRGAADICIPYDQPFKGLSRALQSKKCPASRDCTNRSSAAHR